ARKKELKMTIDVIRDQLKQLRMPAAAAEVETKLRDGKRGQDIKWLSELQAIELVLTDNQISSDFGFGDN
ncbi:MAG: hypothetical protein ACK5WZ_09685, partial [Pseudobdellovibrionaceae bacterium]